MNQKTEQNEDWNWPDWFPDTSAPAGHSASADQIPVVEQAVNKGLIPDDSPQHLLPQQNIAPGRMLDEIHSEPTGEQQSVSNTESVPETNQERFVSFSLAGTSYLIPVAHLIEIEKVRTITPFPSGPDWLLGLTNLRGEVLSVIDCRRLFRLEPTQQPELSRMIVVKMNHRDLTTALIVDRVDGLVGLAPQDIQSDVQTSAACPAAWIQGVGKHRQRSALVLNLDGLLQSLDDSW